MRFWTILGSFVIASAVAVTVLAFVGLPYKSLSQLANENPYEPPKAVPEKVFVTLSEIEVNKKKTGTGSPWRVVVQGPKTFDLFELATKGVAALGDALVEPGTYWIIRIKVDGVQVKLKGSEGLVDVKLPSSKIQIVGKFDVVAGKTTRLRLDFDRASLVETGKGDFIFKVKVRLKVLPENGGGPNVMELIPLLPKRVSAGTNDGTIEVLVGDAELGTNVVGSVFLQGRLDGNHDGSTVTLSKDGVPVADVEIITPEDGSYSLALEPGDYVLTGAHAGWLAGMRAFTVPADGVVDLAGLTLKGGDANVDGKVSLADLRLFARSLGAPSPAGTVTDQNDNGITDLLDMVQAAVNLPLPPGFARIDFSGPRAQQTAFNVPIVNLPDVGSTKTQGILSFDRSGPTEPFLSSIAYVKVSSPKPQTAPYAMTSTAHQGFSSLSGLNPNRLSLDFNGAPTMEQTPIINKSGDPPILLDDALFNDPDAVVYFKIQTGGSTRNMERRSYTNGTWRLLDNAGTPNDSTDDTVLATGTIVRYTAFLDYSQFQNSGKARLNVDPGSAFFTDLQKNFGTTSLDLIGSQFQSPVFSDNPGNVVVPAQMYAMFEVTATLVPAT